MPPPRPFMARYEPLWNAGGTPIGAMDMLIAAHALSLRLTFVTNNTREFTRVQGLSVENWTT
jgi:tRNA(fMet)-specific endonuclease VapC